MVASGPGTEGIARRGNETRWPRRWMLVEILWGYLITLAFVWQKKTLLEGFIKGRTLSYVSQQDYLLD